MAKRKKQIPKYVKVYNQILKMISGGMYPEGSKLPTETELSEELNVSRMTLRQSLLLLKEDGIIETRQGSGNYIKKVVVREKAGLEEIGNIIEKTSRQKIRDTEYELNLTPITEYAEKIFQRKTPVIVEIHRVMKGEERKIACSLSMILTDVLEEYSVDLNDMGSIKEFLETAYSRKGHRVCLEMKITPVNQMVKKKELSSESGYYMLIVENIYDMKDRLILHNKHYIAAEDVNMNVNWYNN